jgi:hypothetical protein
VKVTVTTGKYRESGTKYWKVRYVLPNGKPERKFFPDKQSAENFADTKRRESDDAAMIPEALKFEAAECAEKLQPHNWTIRRATDYVLERVIPFENKPCIRNLIPIYLKEQAARGLAKDTMSEMRHRMKVYGETFGEQHLHELKLEDYSEWMQALASAGYEAQGIRHFLKRVHGFIKWAIPRGYCVGNPLAALQRPIVRSRRPVVFRLPRVQKLLEIAPKHGLLTSSVLGTLAAIRPCELRVLGRLRDIFNPDEKLITVDHESFAASERRVIELEGEWGDAVIAWLQDCKMDDPIIPWPERRHVEALRKELGFWSHDAMRHTGASAHYAFFSDVGKTMKMLGHARDQKVFHNHCKALMTRKEAKALYALRPS